METRTDPKTRFAADTTSHQLTVLLDQGLYRHLRFADPASRTSWFEIITVPGLLTINGDMGTFTFSREADMFGFFRRADGGINDYYWTEKLLAGDQPAKAYSAKVFAATIRQDAEGQLDDAEADGGQRAAALAELEEAVLSVASEGEHEAYRALAGFSHDLLDFTDAWEHDFTEYSFRYLWSLHAIVHGIAEYTGRTESAKVLAAA
ncbi:MAG TPA: hypothetical protein VF885_25135 [Arthrobacter sp.]